MPGVNLINATGSGTILSANAALFSFPVAEALLPTINVTSANWLITNNTYFATQEVQCLYPISGQYGNAPRFLYYVLAIFSVLVRSHDWIATAALASVMTYSGIAAIHALVFVSVRKQLVSKGYEWVSVTASDPSELLWLPVWPMAWDLDCDAVLGVVGAGFLLVAPMQIWSTTFNRSRSRTILLLWSFLMFIGTVCALINEVYVDTWAFPQFRFCPFVQEDLPVSNSGTASNIYNDPGFLDNLNTTIWGPLMNSSSGPYGTCLHPCFSTTWPLRESAEIVVMSADTSWQADSTTGWRLMAFIYFLVGSSGTSSLTVFVATRLKFRYTDRFWHTNPMSYLHSRSPKIMLRFLCELYLRIIHLYARIISPISFIAFIIWIEWVIWYDLEGENISHVGQWGSVVAVGLVMLAAVLGHTWRPQSKSTRNAIPPHDSTQPSTTIQRSQTI